MTDTKEIIGTVYSVEWLNEETMEPDDDREPGTYVTIKVPDDSRWGFGKVAIRYVEGEYTEPPPPTEGKERSQITVAAHDDAIAAIEFSLTIDDHFDRFEFLQAFLNGDVDSDEWDDWHEFLASRKAPPPGNTEGE